MLYTPPAQYAEIDYKPIPNQLYRVFLGVNGLNPWDGYDSSSRKQMFASQIGQILVIKGATERKCQTGMEREYGKYTFSIKMPVDGDVIKVVERYQNTYGEESIAFSPQSIILYEDSKTKEVGMINIPRYCSFHPHFGFEYHAKPGLSQVRVKASIPKDTILVDSPSITPDGGYKYGIELNIAFMSHPAVSEDGVMICEDVLPKLAFKTYETRVVEWGKHRFPLNLYGDENNYKPFPDLGEYIREDGILMSLRAHNRELAIVRQSKYDLMEVDSTYDRSTYAGEPGDPAKRKGRVVDIRVYHDGNAYSAGNPMDAQPLKYDRARRKFYQDLVKEYEELRSKRKDHLQITPELQRQLIEAMVVLDKGPVKIVKNYRNATLDEWRVEFVIEYEITPNIGFKVTDGHGGKGVICHIAKPEEMPLAANGVRADIVMDGASTVNRMNLGRFYEQYINCASHDIVLRITKELEVDPRDKSLMVKLAALEKKEPERFNNVWDYLMGYYRILSPARMYPWFTSTDPNVRDRYKMPRVFHLTEIIRNQAIYLYLPPENEAEMDRCVPAIEKYYQPTYGPVSYIGYSGRRVTTRQPVRIGSVYIILLEKIGDDWTAVSSGKWQHYGVLSQITNADKHLHPTRQQAVRAWGEAEIRNLLTFVGAWMTAEILDRNNNPRTHYQIVQNILATDTPTNIYSIVDRKQIPLGGAKPVQLVKHLLECYGARFVYKDFEPNWQQPTAPKPFAPSPVEEAVTQ